MQADLVPPIDTMSEQQLLGKIQEAQKAAEGADDRTLRLGEKFEKLKDLVHTDINIRLARVEERTSNVMWVVGVMAAAIIATAVQLFLMNGRLSAIEQNVSGIRADVSGMRLSQTATNPKDPRNIQEAKRVLREAEKNKVKIPPSVVEDTGKKFLEAAKDDPSAWGAALAFADYRSYLNLPNLPVNGFYPLGAPAIPGIKAAHYEFQRVLGKGWPQFTTSLKRVPIALSARFEPIGHPLTGEPSEGPAFLLGIGGDLTLDGFYLRSVVLEGVTIHYNNGPVILENVTFINCRFVMDDVDNSRALSSQLLASSAVTFKVPAA